MRSMTGFGKGKAAEGGLEAVVELRSVNNRFLEVNSRIPRSLLSSDEIIRALVQKNVARGTVDVFFTLKAVSAAEDSAENPTKSTVENSAETDTNNRVDSRASGGQGAADTFGLKADLAAIAAYKHLADSLAQRFGIVDDLSFTALLSRGLIEREEIPSQPELIARLTRAAAHVALSELNSMREVEGEGIKTDLLRLIREIETLAKRAGERAPLVVDDYRKKLTSRISELLAEQPIDEVRLINEVAFFADKADINEELSRLFSHISQFEAACEGSESLGRKLDFISQEIGREINTLGSKSNDIALTGIAVEMKNLLEKIKEQIRNVE